jgi:hypothetical protein
MEDFCRDSNKFISLNFSVKFCGQIGDVGSQDASFTLRTVISITIDMIILVFIIIIG